MYQAFGLLQSNTDFNLNEAEARLRAKFLKDAVSRIGDRIVVVRGDWQIAMALNAGPEVLADSAELAEKIAGADGGEIAACSRRVEVGSESLDPFMEHFNDFLLVIEVLQSFQGVIAIDPREPALM